jgi:hypothetical protein
MGIHAVTSAGTAPAIAFTSARFTITAGTATCTTHVLNMNNLSADRQVKNEQLIIEER